MPLTRAQIESTQPGPKPIRLFDGRGLYLEIAPNGGRWWRFKYRYAGKEKRLSLGVYPEVGLKEARQKLDDVRRQLSAGVDPGEQRRAAKAVAKHGGVNTFEVIAHEWFAMHEPRWASGHSEKILGRLERDIFPWLGRKGIADIAPLDVLNTLRRIEERGANETAHRAMQNCSQVFRYAVATGRAVRDVTADLRGALRPAISRHHPSITDPKGVGALLRAIDGYGGSFVTQSALRLAPLVFVRPGELRMAEWSEIEMEAGEWRIPAARMKGRRQHIVPLATQAVAILKELQPMTGGGRFVFPGERTPDRCMSNNTMNAALRRLGYSTDQMTGHGFRSIASTLLNEQGWDTEAIERQLAHVEGNAVKAAYNYAQHLPVRRKMMQAWADYLVRLKEGAVS